MLDVATLYATYERPIWRYLRARLVAVDNAVIDDLAAEVWARVWAGRAGYREMGAARAKPWVYQIAHNLLMDYLRRDRIVEWHSLDALTEDGWSPVALLQFDEIAERERVERALAHLTEKQRAVMRLRFWEGREYRDMAEVGSENTTKKLRARALVTLRPYLEVA